MGSTLNEYKNTALVSVKLTTILGFSIHPEKSKLFSYQVIEFLGFIINSKKMTVSLSESKQNDNNAVPKEVKIMKKNNYKSPCKINQKIRSCSSRYATW